MYVSRGLWYDIVMPKKESNIDKIAKLIDKQIREEMEMHECSYEDAKEAVFEYLQDSARE